jgi:hypothetical protein
MIASRRADFQFFIYDTEMVTTKRLGPLKGVRASFSKT